MLIDNYLSTLTRQLFKSKSKKKQRNILPAFYFENVENLTFFATLLLTLGDEKQYRSVFVPENTPFISATVSVELVLTVHLQKF